MQLLDTLNLSARGQAWLKVLPNECLTALTYIESQLLDYWQYDSCFPTKSKVLLPFHMIAPDEVLMVVICKEPYASQSMATGIPIEVGSSMKPTASENAFTSLIRNYWDSVDRTNFMKCYYSSGILVINASFTISPVHDKRYSITSSHFPLWTRFCRPLVTYLNSRDLPIVALGTEAKGLVRNLPNGHNIFNCTFPIEYKMSQEFLSLMEHLVESVVFDRNKPSS